MGPKNHPEAISYHFPKSSKPKLSDLGDFGDMFLFILCFPVCFFGNRFVTGIKPMRVKNGKGAFLVENG